MYFGAGVVAFEGDVVKVDGGVGCTGLTLAFATGPEFVARGVGHGGGGGYTYFAGDPSDGYAGL